ncbi:MAG TPA: acyl-CoA dehydrogenase family protein [Ktedonobacterales bacterium]|jgi:alkylation response protein AidB-like acyl-CoA dehydrogenase|nr:acyl-CoA dehydrogenase family protein [Ktedonobacterales bacterium]
MIDFELTDDQRAMRDLAHTFAEQEIRPVAAELDEREEFPWELVKKAGELGLTSYAFPEALGGLGIGDELTNCIISEELAWGCAGVATVLGGTHLASIPILLDGSDEQQARLLKPVVQRNGLAALALTEASAGSDVSAMTTTARREGDEYILNGAKRFISNGGIAELYVVFAVTDRAAAHRGITAFIVAGDTPGLSGGRKEQKLGIRCSHTGEVLLDEVRVPLANRLGDEGSGFKLAMRTLDRSRPMVAAFAVGIARAAYEHAREYAKGRIQFGKPIADNQAIQFMLADMATEIQAARLMTWWAAVATESGRPYLYESSMAKNFASDVAMKVTTDAVQIFGGYGYIREYPVEKLFRDAKITQIYEGTNQIQKIVVANQILK